MNDKKGAVLIIVMGFVALMALSTIYLIGMVKADIDLIGRAKYNTQAQYAAEAGINHALARIKSENFASRTDFGGSLDNGTYSVTFSEQGGRYLVSSTGTVGNVSKTVSCEIENLTPTALRCISAAGNDIRINSFVAGAEINGDIHANDDVYLKSGPLIAYLTVTGDVSATDTVKEGSRLHRADGFWGAYLDLHVYINGDNEDEAVVEEGANRVTFPIFNYDAYRQDAMDSGTYYSGDQVFSGVTLNPSEGMVFVDGDVTFVGNCTINGGLVADDILVLGTLNQVKKGTKNAIIAREGDVGILGRLYTEEAVVYAGRDIRSLEITADIEINGVLMARRDIYMWNFITLIDYQYVETYPSDMGDEEDQPFGVVSWNK
ncbi:MAG: hypothetical protein GF408_03390 [Candidatus Omnitrophica bacterium]|nr:hypothetical protein [Candidatus Omnitrophota bacterium]